MTLTPQQQERKAKALALRAQRLAQKGALPSDGDRKAETNRADPRAGSGGCACAVCTGAITLNPGTVTYQGASSSIAPNSPAAWQTASALAQGVGMGYNPNFYAGTMSVNAARQAVGLIPFSEFFNEEYKPLEEVAQVEPIIALRGVSLTPLNGRVFLNSVGFGTKMGSLLPGPLHLQAKCGYDHDHKAPDPECSCGFYALKEEPERPRTGTYEIAAVKLSGTVIECEKGYRAEFQDICDITILTDFPGCAGGLLCDGEVTHLRYDKDTYWELRCTECAKRHKTTTVSIKRLEAHLGVPVFVRLGE